MGDRRREILSALRCRNLYKYTRTYIYMKENELIPGLGEKLKQWKCDNVSKIKDIMAYMKSFPVPMTEIGLTEAAQISQTVEKNISAHLAGSPWFDKTAKKGVYRLRERRKYGKKKQDVTIAPEPKQRMDDGINTSKAIDAALDQRERKEYLDGMSATEKSDEQKEFERSTIPKKTTKKDPLQVIRKTAYFCPHCSKEISITTERD